MHFGLYISFFDFLLKLIFLNTLDSTYQYDGLFIASNTTTVIKTVKLILFKEEAREKYKNLSFSYTYEIIEFSVFKISK